MPLAWSGAPKGTAWFAVTVIDPAGPITHWYVIDIPATTTGIKQGASYSHAAPGKQVTSWSGPCPGGGPDAYEFTVYAMPSSYKPPDTYAGYVEDEDGLAANAIGNRAADRVLRGLSPGSASIAAWSSPHQPEEERPSRSRRHSPPL